MQPAGRLACVVAVARRAASADSLVPGAQGGNAPLIWATYSGNVDVLTLLLQFGADTSVLYKQARRPRAAAGRQERG